VIKRGYKKHLLLLILISTLLRLITAALTELGNDEVYYWTYAQKLQWNYFDHPPMVAVWIRVFTADLSLEQFEVFIRLGSILSCALATVILFDAVKKMHSEKAAWYAALLYNASLYAGIIAGLFILPDSPQILFWICALWSLVKIAEQPRRTLFWILFGLATGLCIMSKVHGVFLWFGFGCYILFQKRDWLKIPQLYLAALITAVVASPILFWNLANDFITYRFHSERVTVHEFALNWSGFAREVFGEFFYNNPFNVIITVIALIAFKKLKSKSHTAISIFNFIALPMIAILLIISLFRNTLPHWSGPAYVTLLPLAAIWLSEKEYPRIQKWATGFALFIMLLGIGLINFFPGTMGKKEMEKLGKGDFTLDMNGWTKAGNAFSQIRQKHIEAGIMKPANPVVAHKWFTAAHEDYYFCRPENIELIGLGEMNDLHHYLWMNEWRIPVTDMQNAWCIVPSNESYNAKEQYNSYYDRADSVATIIAERSGEPCRNFTVYKLSGWKGYKSALKEVKTSAR
jgi:4-amino-4-deoxy-L-arabinose transferase-like glycosyltransferase